MSEEVIRNEFNEWARRGRGEEMASGHGDVTRQALERVTLTSDDRGLDVGCGIGWAAKLIKDLGAGEVWGVDLSEEMIARAPEEEGLHFRAASANNLPFENNYFTFILSVESLYYYEDMLNALKEIHRVGSEGARFLNVIDLFSDNTGSVGWAKEFEFPVHIASRAGYEELYRQAGFSSVSTHLLQDRRPIKSEVDFQPNRWFPVYDQYRQYREIGSLLIDASV